MNFKAWLEEKKKTKESLPPTVTSSPLRGQNQDQSGYNGKNDVGDYTISDSTIDSWEENPPAKRIKAAKELTKLGNRHGSKALGEEQINELSPELVGKVHKARALGGKPSKTPAASKTLSKAVTKAWLKAKVGAVKEASMNPAVGANRIQPVNQADNTPRKGSSAVSKRMITGLQSSANRRVSALDQAAQQKRDQEKRDREQETQRRNREAEKRKQDAANSQ